MSQIGTDSESSSGSSSLQPSPLISHSVNHEGAEHCYPDSNYVTISTPQKVVCSVCGGLAIGGTRLGVKACDACTFFFISHSALPVSAVVQCPYENRCIINLVSREFCQSCRFKKCLALGMDVNYKPVENPCAVCGAEANGSCFGAEVCNACKMFFHRYAITGSKTLTENNCTFGGPCVIKPGSPCNYCRLQKCFAVGMKVSQTSKTRTQEQQNVEELEEDEFKQECTVCGGDSIGYRKGALVCGACYSFFKAYLMGKFKSPPRCYKDCEVTLETRHLCPFCRLQKCFNVGMKADSNMAKAFIPQQKDDKPREGCHVCGDVVYCNFSGANVCRSCGHFFTGCLKSTSILPCKKQEQCVITVSNRTNCRFCRYQKCLKVGMTDHRKVGCSQRYMDGRLSKTTAYSSGQEDSSLTAFLFSKTSKAPENSENTSVDSAIIQILKTAKDSDKMCSQPAITPQSVSTSRTSIDTQRKKSRKRVLLHPDDVCAVCGDKPIGVRLGAIVCEACKKFFEKRVENPDIPKCQYEDHCEITIKSRSNCPCCRFYKCVEVGMTSYRTGDYKQKGIEASNSVESENRTVSCSSGTVTEDVYSNHSDSNAGNTVAWDNHQSLESDDVMTCPTSSEDRSQCLSRESMEDDGIVSFEEPNELSNIIRFHKDTCVFTLEKVRDMLNKPLNFVNIPCPTPLDVWQFFAPQMDLEIRQISGFIANLPYLPVNIEQLYQKSIFKIYLLRIIRSLSPEGLLLHDGRFLDFPVVNVLFGEHIAMGMLHISETIKHMEVSDGHLALFIILMIMESEPESDSNPLVLEILTTLETKLPSFPFLRKLSLKLDEINLNFQNSIIPWLRDNYGSLQLPQTFCDVFGISIWSMQYYGAMPTNNSSI